MRKERKRNRLKYYDYASNGDYFITICVHNYEEILSDVSPDGKITLTEIGRTAEKMIEEIEKHYKGVFLDNYVIMPNHIHLLISMRFDPEHLYKLPNISTVVGSFKSSVSKELKTRFWQKSFYDHIITDDNDYNNIYDYIDANPLVWHRDKLNRRKYRD